MSYQNSVVVQWVTAADGVDPTLRMLAVSDGNLVPEFDRIPGHKGNGPSVRSHTEENRISLRGLTKGFCRGPIIPWTHRVLKMLLS